MGKKGIIIITLALSIVLGFYIYKAPAKSCRDFNQGTVSFSDTQSISVNLATTTSEQAKGLSGCSAIRLGQGMLFVFPEKINAVFWMKDMIIPIDIIWLSDNKVIGIEHNVPPPKDDNLIKYYAPQAVDAVLELGAGDASRLNISIDTVIQVKKNYN